MSAAAPANLAAFGAGNTQMGVDRFCGRFFAANAGVADTSVCSKYIQKVCVNLEKKEINFIQKDNLGK